MEDRELDEILSDHGDLEGVFAEVIGEGERVFTNCNVCGRELIMTDEEAMGMCQICANE